MELTRENFRAMIYYDFQCGLSRQECIDQLTSTFGDKAPSFATVKRWYNKFNRGRRSLTDESHEGRSKSVVVSENIDAVQKLIMQDRHVTYCEIETTLGISSTNIYKILHDHLAVKKVCSRSHIIPDFFLFPRLKVWLGGQKFSSNEVIASVDAYFAKQDAQYYLNRLKGWEHRWKKCIDLKGDYVEK
ncbi:Histone-lysine N-methyltransferase SETMAR [Trachymyrmex zeteki]|uniref:Histone-lysine N-methyltransferase SETMAR n=1 Tax=Mycetomoellerius zeteki TaxID=64791 RepID=A0A151WTD8_9HYME|nr:Histone-lysine N-methyltransferase SETMAR [Trachymyrmex zeteki]